jgi:hypothetical protein
MAAHAQLAFPEASVLRSFREVGADAGDTSIVTRMQTEMLPHAMLSLLKPAVLHCVRSNRTYLSKADVAFGRAFADWPSVVVHDEPWLVDPAMLYPSVADHTKLIGDVCVRHHIVSTAAVKVSKEVVGVLAREIECSVRGFVDHMRDLSDSKHFVSTHFHDALRSILRDDIYLKHESSLKVY